jgi:acetyltransferase-like isoleucine patch superfamily enzyme
MGQPLLSVTIPTYNRVRFLKQTLDVLLPQLRDGVEVMVLDNCSPDGTWEYLETLEGKVVCVKHERNIGGDNNIMACFARSTGQYVWLLCDDDLPCRNTVSCLLEAIEKFGHPPFLFLSSEWQDIDLSHYSNASVETGWTSFDRNGFLRRVGQWFTVASSIVVRRDCLEFEFASRWVPVGLEPAAITLSTVGRYNQGIVSDKPLVICRGGNSGRYDWLTTFTKKTRDLFRAVREMGFDEQVLRSVYDQCLRGVVAYGARSTAPWPRGVLNLLRSSYSFGALYTVVLPALLERALGRIPGLLSARRRLRAFLRERKLDAYEREMARLDRAASTSFRRHIGQVGRGCRVRHPIYLKGPQYVTIGDDFSSDPGLRIEAWDEFTGVKYSPRITIGRNGVFGFNVHIGAIDRIVIGDDVGVSSYVLITDHLHGNMTAQLLGIRRTVWPLWSRGPVVIEDNVLIGEGARILPGVRIGHHAVIGANAVVTRNVAPGQIVGGVPARVIGQLAEKPGGVAGTPGK